MRILKIITAAGLAAGVAACAANGPKDEQLHLATDARELAETQATAETSDVVCETRQKLGSHMVERICYSRVDNEEMRVETQEDLRRAQRSGPRSDQPQR